MGQFSAIDCLAAHRRAVAAAAKGSEGRVAALGVGPERTATAHGALDVSTPGVFPWPTPFGHACLRIAGEGMRRIPANGSGAARFLHGIGPHLFRIAPKLRREAL